MIGMALVADAFGAHVPKGYIYTAMVFSVVSNASIWRIGGGPSRYTYAIPMAKKSKEFRRRASCARECRHVRHDKSVDQPPSERSLEK